MSGVAAVEAHGLVKRFGAVRAIAGIDLEIAAGSAIHLAGPNGAGKSTLLRVLAGLMRPSRGEVRVLGVDPYSSAGRRLRGGVGFLGAQSGLYPELQVRENLEFRARLLGLSSAHVDLALERLGLTDRAHMPVRTLSFGYRRRVGLASALLGDPDLILLDEPWNGLDDEACKRLEATLSELLANGPTLVVASHQSGLGSQLFDDSLRLEQGRLVA